MSQKVFLVGLPGAGKTTLGMELANHLGIPFVDLDLEIEKHTKNSVRTLFSEQGEAHFRQLEKFHLTKIIEEISTFVMATGGGTPCFFDNMQIMKSCGRTVFIDTQVETIKKRLQQDTIRPLMRNNTLEELLKKRISWYRQAENKATSIDQLFDLFKN